MDPTSCHHRQRQLNNQRSSALRPRLRRLPDVEEKQGGFVERLGVSHDKDAPSRLKEFIDLINLERNRMIEELVRCLGVDASTECHRLADQCVVHRHDARPEVSAVSEAADTGRTEETATFVTVQGFEPATTVEQRPSGIDPKS